MLSDDSVRNFGLRAGRVYGIDVHIHWFLLIVIALRLLHMSISEVPEGYVKDWGKVFTIFSTFTIALVGSVFLHELGHAFAAFREGGSCERIVLWPLGGLAYCSAPQTPWAQFFVAAGGPLVTLALAVVGGLVCWVAGWGLLPLQNPQYGFAETLFQFLFVWNSLLLFVNLLPCYPLDGGKMLHTWLWRRMGTSQGSLLHTLAISRVVAIVAIVFGVVLLLMGFTDKAWSYHHPVLDQLDLLLLLCGVLHFSSARRIREQLMYGDIEEGGAFGYDFSQGYTSLEGSPSRAERRPSWRERRRSRKARHSEDRERRIDREVRARLDELLEKISREGIESLSRDERRFLENASKHMRESETKRD